MGREFFIWRIILSVKTWQCLFVPREVRGPTHFFADHEIFTQSLLCTCVPGYIHPETPYNAQARLQPVASRRDGGSLVVSIEQREVRNCVLSLRPPSVELGAPIGLSDGMNV